MPDIRHLWERVRAVVPAVASYAMGAAVERLTGFENQAGDAADVENQRERRIPAYVPPPRFSYWEGTSESDSATAVPDSASSLGSNRSRALAEGAQRRGPPRSHDDASAPIGLAGSQLSPGGDGGQPEIVGEFVPLL